MNKQFQKVISGLECCMSGQPEGLGCDRAPCPYNDFEDCEGMLHRDAIALLKAQEPPTDTSISSAIECLLHPQDADDSDIAQAIDTAVRAMRLLKAQEPRVMTLDEALGAEVNVDQCWLEVNDIRQIYLADAVVCPEHLERADIQRWGATDCQLPLDLYGEYWRMWTAKPTDEQREAIPWN